jgi:predicted lipoprotein
LPEIYYRRIDIAALISEASAFGWESAGETYGEIRGDIGASYNFITYGTVFVREVNTESRNGFLVVEVEGLQTDYEVRISIGPAFSGSAIRDSIRFIEFTHFVNQVDFARLSSELNRFGNENIHRSVDVLGLAGQTIEFTGSFAEPAGDDVISIMPLFMEEA